MAALIGSGSARIATACLGGAFLVLACSGPSPVESGDPSTEFGQYLSDVRDDWILSESEVLSWHEVKDEKGPAFTGNASWRQFVGYLEEKLGEYGVVDIQRNQWSFKRWHSSEWPDHSSWSLVADGAEIEVANYGANSGATGSDGVTAELVYYDKTNPPEDIAGKIVVFSTVVDQALIEQFSNSDFEYRSAFESYPEYGRPIPDDLTDFQSLRIFSQLLQIPALIDIATEGGAVGVLFVLDAGSDLMAGMYTFPVPAIYDVPSLYLDRNAGRKVIEDARAGAQATLRLEATISDSTAYQLIGYLPGKNYGTPQDEQIQLTTHTDGPSISQDNGAFGILGVVRYMSRIPQAERPRTLMVFLDCRHFMPGAEQAFEEQDWFARNPDARDAIVGVIGMEHLGQIEFVENGDTLTPSGRVYPSYVWTTNNSNMVELATRAVEDNSLPSAVVRNVARPGVHGRNQGQWFGMAKFAPAAGIPAFAIMGFMGAYWATSSDIERFDPELFRRQVATFVQLTGELMTADLADLSQEIVADESPLDASLQNEIIVELQRQIGENYVIEDGANKLVGALAEARLSGDFDTPMRANQFLNKTNKLLQAAYPDRHLAMLNPERYREMTQMFHSEEPQFSEGGLLQVAGVSAVSEISRDGLNQIGYIALQHFVGSDRAIAAIDNIFKTFADSERLIIDLRASRGGDGEMVKVLSSYLFDVPTHLVTSIGPKKPDGSRPLFERVTEPNHLSQSFADKPVDVLISDKTFSAAESFAFGLKVSGRARLIGEATGGGGHMNDFFPLPGGFGASISVGRTFDPQTGLGWEGTGVLPDIEVEADHALSETIALITRESGKLDAFDAEQTAIYRQIQDYSNAWYAADAARIEPLLGADFEACHQIRDRLNCLSREQKIQATRDGKGEQPPLYQNRIIGNIEVNGADASAELVLRATRHKLYFRKSDTIWLLTKDESRDKGHHG